MPAIFCWLKTILPPVVYGGSCSASAKTSEAVSRFLTPENLLDANKNGILDGNELIARGELNLVNPGKIITHNETIPLRAELLSNGRIIDTDNFNTVSFSLEKLEVYSGSFRSGKLNTVYVANQNENISNLANIEPYIGFVPMDIRATNGVASYSFTAKNSDLDATFSAHILTKDSRGNTVVDKKSRAVKVSVRSERISIQSEVKKNGKTEPSTVIEAGNPDGVTFRMQKVDTSGFAGSEKSFPYVLKVYDDITNALVYDPINISTSEYVFRNNFLNTS